MATATEMLNLDTVSGRSEKIRFELTDRLGNATGALHPTLYTDIDNNTQGGIKRRLTNFELAADEADEVNVLSDRVIPYWVLSDGTEYQMGVFLWADTSRVRWGYGLPSHNTLVDQGIILSQPLLTTVSFSSGTRIVDAISTVATLLGITSTNIPSNPATLGSSIAWPAGESNTYAKVVSDLCSLGGFYDWYFGNTGVFNVTEAQDPALATATLEYLDGGRIVSGSPVESNDLLESANIYVVIDSSRTTAEVVGRYQIPDTAPNSYANRGFYIPKFIDLPGIGTSANAYLAARSAYQQSVKAYETITFTGPPDPRHDTFDTVNYRGTNYAELSWKLRCEPGGAMEHTIGRVYL